MPRCNRRTKFWAINHGLAGVFAPQPVFLFSRFHFARRLPRTGRGVLSGRAFTLIELLIVLGLMAMLGGILLGAGRSVFETGRRTQARAELAVLSAALEAYRVAHGDYPLSLEALARQPVPPDPWLRPYRYAYKSQEPWTNPAYVLCSDGPDGRANPALRAGGYPDATAVANADNVWANQP